MIFCLIHPRGNGTTEFSREMRKWFLLAMEVPITFLDAIWKYRYIFYSLLNHRFPMPIFGRENNVRVDYTVCCCQANLNTSSSPCSTNICSNYKELLILLISLGKSRKTLQNNNPKMFFQIIWHYIYSNYGIISFDMLH